MTIFYYKCNYCVHSLCEHADDLPPSCEYPKNVIANVKIIFDNEEQLYNLYVLFIATRCYGGGQ